MDNRVIQVIPQVFYDLIARVIPGFVLLLTCYLIWSDELYRFATEHLHADKISSVWVALILLPISYILSLILEAYAKWMKLDEWLLSTEQEEVVRNVMKNESVRVRVFQYRLLPRELPHEAILYDTLRLRDAEVGARLTKLRAERSLFTTLLLGWAIIVPALFVSLSAGSLTCEVFVIAFPSLAIGIVAMGARYRNLTGNYQRSLCNHWLLLIDPGHPKLK